jgi:branched-chain amino acid transport system permease protein
MILASAIVTGLGLGSMYGLLALGFHVTWAVSNTVNFSQGSAMMVGAVLAYFAIMVWGWPVVLGIPAALVGCALLGLAIERFAVRPFVRRGSDAWLMATVAVGIVLDNLALFTFGKEPRSLALPHARDQVELFGVGVFAIQLLIPLAGLGVAYALHQLSRRTLLGRAWLATAQNPDAARLMGIDTGRAIAVAFALSAAFAGLAGILIAPLFNVSGDMGTLFGIKAFAAAILGGIGSAWGVVVAGLIYGVIEALITALLGSVYTNILTFALIIVALAFLPNGLFGRAAVRKV